MFGKLGHVTTIVHRVLVSSRNIFEISRILKEPWRYERVLYINFLFTRYTKFFARLIQWLKPIAVYAFSLSWVQSGSHNMHERFDLTDLNIKQFYWNFMAEPFEFASLDDSKIIEFARYKYNEHTEERTVYSINLLTFYHECHSFILV